ncbi:SPFH domain-containing protein [Candidatus Borrarchaeum sp.]|uniref:SPFH domain-containing protein n=1 Tax=Candidatus Borrarchaeum sp. TaxID=2846742 RepID=UPI002580FF0E|nr:SPFH domain-containing protein [Candidatus Borrarchaeum sp.]
MWEAIGSVSSGLALAAFIVAAAVTVLRRRLLHKENLIKSAPESERPSLVQAALDSYSIVTTDLTKQQRYDLIMEQIRQRARRFRITSVVIVILAFLAAALAAYALGVKSNSKPEEKRYSFDFDNQSLIWAVNYLDQIATDFDIQLDQKILSGEVKTRLFSVHLNDAKLEDIMDIFCSKAIVDIPFVWGINGKTIFIRPNHIESGSTESLSDSGKQEPALRIVFLDGNVAYVGLTLYYHLPAKNAPFVAAKYGNQEQASKHLLSIVQSNAISELERYSLEDARSMRAVISDAIKKASEADVAKTGYDLDSILISQITKAH